MNDTDRITELESVVAALAEQVRFIGQTASWFVPGLNEPPPHVREGQKRIMEWHRSTNQRRMSEEHGAEPVPLPRLAP